MKKRILLILAYTVFIAVISALITTAWFHHFVFNKAGNSEQQALVSLPADKVAESPIADGEDIIEIFSYGYHYCVINEKNVAALENRLPTGKKLIRLHFNLDTQGGLARFAPVFATLQVMGIEEAHRESAYQAVIKDKVDLGDQAQRAAWLEKNNINLEQYNTVSQSAEVKDLMNYMVRVTQHYNINATPSFIVNKKWVALQEGDFSAFADKLLTLVETDRAPEK